ncbi:DNA polymerase IV [Verrucomicrobia bacterium LW23]|nr:DNA polymerase IV [Verrucomicrobia bacterium LW23]
MRKIIHLDMDCFYAAVEMRERPELAGLPIAVGGGSKRGVICTCNYKARQYGVRSAMPGFMARQRCPDLVFLPVRFDLYRATSQVIRAIFHQYTPLVEPLSLDEAYLDVTDAGRYAWDIAREIRARILSETQLTASAGIAPNKMLAKIASDWRKPNGQFAVLPEQVHAFMAALPVRKIWGVGPKSAERFAARGINTCGDLQKLTLPEMAAQFGKWGEELYHLCRGEDNRAVRPHRIRKSLSTENTFFDNLTTLAECQEAIDKLGREVLDDLRAKVPERRIRNAYVTVKFSDFTRTTRQCVCTTPTLEIWRTLLAEAWQRKPLPVRLLGTGVQFADDDSDEDDDHDSAQERQAELFAADEA